MFVFVHNFSLPLFTPVFIYRGADKSLARPARKHLRDARDFNNIETQAVIKFPPPPASQVAERNSRHSDRNINFHSANSSRPSSTQPQPSQPVQNTICGSAHSCSPDDVYCSNSNFHSAHSSRPSSTQPQPAQPVQKTICGSAHSFSPDDGHNDGRNMLR